MKLYWFESGAWWGFDVHFSGKGLPQAKGPWFCKKQVEMTDKDWERHGIDGVALARNVELHGHYVCRKPQGVE